MSAELLDIHEVARIYRTTPGSIRTALWKHRKRRATLRIPLPVDEPGDLRWLRSVVDAHLESLKPAWLKNPAEPALRPEPPAGARKSRRRRPMN